MSGGFRSVRWWILPALAWTLCACGSPSEDQVGAPAGEAEDASSPAAGHAVILLYHHVAADTPGSTSVTPQTFAAHLRHLAENDHVVVPLSRVMEAIENNQPLPDRAVAITFDDAYESVYTEAAPMLEQRGYPYAVFVSTDYVDQGMGNYMSWGELRELEARGAEIGNHSRSHAHYVHRPPSESRAEWRRRISGDIQSAQMRLDEELQRPLRALAYPYGEFTPALTDLAAELGFVAFGQQSGPVGLACDPQALPRFPMASGYARVEGLAEKLRTRPFEIEVMSPESPVLSADAPAPTLRLALAASGARLDALSCFVAGQPPATVRWIDRAAGVVEVKASAPLPVGRSKYTCTAPAEDGGGVFYWYSHLWMTPPAPGEWYKD